MRNATFIRSEEGVSSMEYALLAALVGVFCLLAVKGVGISAGNLFVAICNAVADATNGSSC